jgi:transposase-like protein
MLEWKKQAEAESVSEESGVRLLEGAVGDRKRPQPRRELSAPDPELVERPRRRTFTAEYKLDILRQAEACSQPGEIGALLRREGLYTSHLSAWRKQRDAGALAALARPRGRRKPHPLAAETVRLRQRLERTEAELARARRVIEVQGNVSALLEELLSRGAETDLSGEA